MHEALTEQLKGRQELERKLAKLTKQMDHFERAKREEEVPLLLESHKTRMVSPAAAVIFLATADVPVV